MSFPDIIGLIGVSITLTCHLLVQLQRLLATGVLYPLGNITGSMLVLFSLSYHWNTASVCTEVVWIAISLLGIMRNIRVYHQRGRFNLNAVKRTIKVG